MSNKRSIDTMPLDGGCACFDFINTVHSRTEEERYEYLKSYAHLLKWCARTELMSDERLKRLSERAKKNPEQAQKILTAIIETREMLYRFFSAIAAGEKVHNNDLQAFNGRLSESLAKLRFTDDLELDWETVEPNLNEPVWRVMKSAHDILTQESFDRIKECEACGWVFLDQSKNKSRRWCSMESCGSIHKAKKYYHRKKREEAEKN